MLRASSAEHRVYRVRQHNEILPAGFCSCKACILATHGNKRSNFENMIYRLLADTVVVIHLLFILFVLLGGLLGLWRQWIVWLHLPAMVWGAVIEFANLICPLTPLENTLRIAGGERGYSGGFIEHYLEPIIYPPGLTPTMQIGIGAGVLLINISVYVFVWRQRLRASRVLQ
jgi:hypothetical protein